jgi:AAA domain-containing protein
MAHKPQILLISGQQGSGKTTTTNLVSELMFQAKWNYRSFKFASPLYAMHDAVRNIALEYGIPMPEKDGPLLQMLGTEWGRNHYGQNIWVEICRKNIDSVLDIWTRNDQAQKQQGSCAIIDDCRFPNEFDGFPDAFKVRLQCREEVRKQRTHAWRENTGHLSETALDGYDADGKFDLYIDTEVMPQDRVADYVFRQLSTRALLFKEETVHGAKTVPQTGEQASPA